jgi:hypothetical protein
LLWLDVLPEAALTQLSGGLKLQASWSIAWNNSSAYVSKGDKK